MSGKQMKHNVKKKILAIVSLMLALVILVFFFISLVQLIAEPSNVFVVEEGSIYEEETTYAYIVRREKVLYGENYKNGLVEIKQEGTKVAKGENIFRYYSNNEDSLKQKISELDTEIQETLEGQTQAYSADIQILDNQIEDDLQKLLSTNNIVDIEEYRANISDLLVKKAKIAGERSPSGSYLKSLIEKRRSYEEELNNGQEYIKADTTGVVSYKIDGLEEELSPDNFANLNKKMLESYNIKTGQMVASSSEAGKIVDNFECYLVVFLKSEEAKNAKLGDYVNLRLSDTTEIDATIDSITEQDEDLMIIFKTNKAVQDLISYRKISIDVIWWSYSGLKIPNSSIMTDEDGVNYVIRNRTGYQDKILIKIQKTNKNYSIITNYSDEELKELGKNTEDMLSRKRISLYDEIVTDPKE